MAKMRLAPIFAGAQGEIGAFALVAGQGGTILRRRPTYGRPTSAGQAAQMARLAQAAALWNTLTAEQARAWDAYASTLRRTDSLTGQTYSPKGYNAFSACVVRALQAAPLDPPPVEPPATAFPGDDVVVAATGGTGQATFTASAPNTPGVVTELLAQLLPNPRRKPTTQYKSLAFVTFAPGSLSHPVPLPPGTYLCAFRFVRPSTGQETGLVVVQTVVVT